MAGFAKAALLVTASALGVLFAFGSAVAALFEFQGFPPRDSGPRPGYLALLALGFVASVAAPAICWWVLYLRPSKAGRA